MLDLFGVGWLSYGFVVVYWLMFLGLDLVWFCGCDDGVIVGFDVCFNDFYGVVICVVGNYYGVRKLVWRVFGGIFGFGVVIGFGVGL